ASRLHFDLRLEMGGVLKSWAVPKGPSLDPAVRHLAVRTEDHPMKYIDFAGTIPAGNYGAGEMAIWDEGTYESLEGHPEKAVADGKLVLEFHGKRLRGVFHLVRMREEDQWLLMKNDDEFAQPGWQLETVINDADSKKNSKTPSSPPAAPKKTVK